MKNPSNDSRTIKIPSDRLAKALEDARSVREPRRRSQALARVARCMPMGREQDRVIREAFQAADESGDAYSIVSVASWPMEVLLATGQTAAFRKQLDRLLGIICTEANPVKRQDALKWLVMNNQEMPDDSLRRVLSIFEEACNATTSWKSGRNLLVMSHLINHRDHAKAVELALKIKTPRDRRRALRAIGETELAKRQYGTNHT